MLKDAGLTGCKSVSIPLPKGATFYSSKGTLMTDPQRYRRLIGRLLYLGFTRPNIFYATQQLSQYVQAHRDTHWEGALHILKYLKGCPSLGLFFPSVNLYNYVSTVMLISVVCLL